ncbi:hypothetical protein Q5752_005732 [Cryptotrichosporon argae]
MSRQPHRTYTGREPSSLPAPRTPGQAEAYFARVAGDASAAGAGAGGVRPGRVSKLLGVGGWVLGGVAVVYMSLYANFGKGEHVFSPLRRAVARYTNDMLTLSSSERSLLGLDEPPRVGTGAGAGARLPPRDGPQPS